MPYIGEQTNCADLTHNRIHESLQDKWRDKKQKETGKVNTIID